MQKPFERKKVILHEVPFSITIIEISVSVDFHTEYNHVQCFIAFGQAETKNEIQTNKQTD